MGIEKTDETKSYLLTMMKDDLENGFPVEDEGEMRFLVTYYEEIFRTKLRSDAPVDVIQMEIILKGDENPVRVTVRKYSPPKSAFLMSKVDMLLQLGLFRRNPTSRWVYDPLIVPKMDRRISVSTWTFVL